MKSLKKKKTMNKYVTYMMDQVLPYYATSLRERILIETFSRQQGDIQINYYTSYSGTIKYDAVVTSGGSKSLVEAKVRQYKSNELPDHFLDIQKRDYLLEQAYKLGVSPEVWHFFEDSKLYIWNLNEVEELERDGYTQTHTGFNSKEKHINKKVILRTEDARIYDIPKKDYNKMAVDELNKRHPGFPFTYDHIIKKVK